MTEQSLKPNADFERKFLDTQSINMTFKSGNENLSLRDTRQTNAEI